MNLNLPKLIGHRGVKDIAPENTLESINRAIDFKLKWIEVDVKISKDHIPFLLHDDDLNRTTTEIGSPLDLNYKEIRKLDAGQWFDKKYKGAYPPTLKEVMQLCSQKKIGINIELKPNKGFEKENVVAIINLIKKFNFKVNFYFSSFDYFSAVLIKELFPESHVGILFDQNNYITNIKKIFNQYKDNNFFSCGFDINIISDEIISLCKNYEMKITVYSSKNISILEAYNLWKKGVSSIFIDNPLSYKKILN